MASTLKINTLTGVSTAGSIAVTGEGNSTTTNLQQGLAKVWLSADSDTSPEDSFNRSSGTDNNTGNYTHAFTNNMGNATYAFGGNVEKNTPVLLHVASGERLAGSIQLRWASAFDGTTQDTGHTVTLHGDLA
mgnify:CR=1 FL=1